MNTKKLPIAAFVRKDEDWEFVGITVDNLEVGKFVVDVLNKIADDSSPVNNYAVVSLPSRSLY